MYKIVSNSRMKDRRKYRKMNEKCRGEKKEGKMKEREKKGK
jgi:hypothetical protein